MMQVEKFQFELEGVATAVLSLAQSCQGDSLALLALLRKLEKLHREIRDGMFQESLPNSRHALYALLRDIEAEGGWPYIERMKLQSFLADWQLEAAKETGDGPSNDGNSSDLSAKV